MKRLRISAALTILSLLMTACVSTAPSGSAPASSAPANPAPAANQPPLKIVFFSQQQVQTIAFEMAKEKGYYKAENLDVEVKYFASGTTALQSFKAGEGDIVYSGDVPALRYWADNNGAYRVIAPAERNAKGYQLVTKSTVKTAADLKGKTIATRVGSSGSHFVWAYLKQNNLSDVKIVNMDGPVAISALDRGDIDGFFYWAPFPSRAKEVSGNKVHTLADASAVVAGYYTVLGARPEWLDKNPTAAERFLRASRKGQEYALANKEEMKKYLKDKFDLDPASAEAQWQVEEFLLKMDAAFFKDFQGLSDWLIAENMSTKKLDWDTFAYSKGLKAIDAKLVER